MNKDRAPKRNIDDESETVLPCKVAKCETLVDCDQTVNENVSSRKPNLSYIAMISMALQSVPSKQMLLSEIYEWISEHYPYYRQEDRSWRNSIRHNLSLNECFVKSGRSESGKGSYWSIHPANMEDFGNGDYRRRRARRRVRKCDDELRTLCEPSCVSGESTLQTLQASPVVQFYSGYVPMSSTYVSTSYLNSMFGTEKILNRENQVRNLHQTNRFILPNTVCLPNLQTFTGNRLSTED
ncbi:forkhead box protein A4-A-like [Mizuhopecten yessoensis]|uniref:forkhead box protein A4-A-like n=1 Tax=Mizuhopecten yessoensis TaxID=6573 RepID=UPI000B457477|nr:forkhead box protein A4-A-like [Mizuhopecten yessoensis]